MKRHKKIQACERDQIAFLLASKTSLREIARKLERSFSSIREEVVRNSRGSVYLSLRADELSRERNLASRKANPLKSDEIYRYVFEKLRCGWSPQQIAGRLKRKSGGKTVICHETIYRYIYSPQGRNKGLYEYLVRQHKQRKKWYSRHSYRRGISDRVSIDLRPKSINSRKKFGHWEIDSVEGKAHKKGVHTFLERKTRYYHADLIDNIDSEYGIRSQLKVFGNLPQKARLSATFDNGKENYSHTKLRIHLKMKTFFCDPNAAWQKGANEHFNGILRRYIPKKTDLTTVSQTELDSIIEEINERPLKCLQYEKPIEAFTRELKLINYPR